MAGRAGSKAGDNRVSFTKASAERIADAVRKVEAGNRNAAPFISAPRGFGGGGSAIRAATFTGSWDRNSLKTVTFQGGTATVMATNQLFTIGDACEPQVAYIGRVSSPEPGDAQAKWHLLNVQHHETTIIVSVTLTTAALEFTRRLVHVPYPGETSTLSILLATDTACS